MLDRNKSCIKIKGDTLEKIVERGTLISCNSCSEIIFARKYKFHHCFSMKNKKKMNDQEVNVQLSEEDRKKLENYSFLNEILGIQPVVKFFYKFPNLYRKMYDDGKNKM